MGGSARSRILFELIVECARFGEPQADGSQLIPINESELAKRTGLSRETVSREVTKLKAKHLLIHTGQTISVTSIKKLQDELGDDL